MRMEKELRNMLILDHHASMVSPAESRSAYIASELRNREAIAKKETLREIGKQLISTAKGARADAFEDVFAMLQPLLAPMAGDEYQRGVLDCLNLISTKRQAYLSESRHEGSS